jgi:hypothetical protein
MSTNNNYAKRVASLEIYIDGKASCLCFNPSLLISINHRFHDIKDGFVYIDCGIITVPSALSGSD